MTKPNAVFSALTIRTTTSVSDLNSKQASASLWAAVEENFERENELAKLTQHREQIRAAYFFQKRAARRAVKSFAAGAIILLSVAAFAAVNIMPLIILILLLALSWTMNLIGIKYLIRVYSKDSSVRGNTPGATDCSNGEAGN